MEQKTIRIGHDVAVEFLQGMADRMEVSFHKYGAVADAYPHKVDALASLQKRIEKYLETRNTEYLIDAANFAMIEFMAPRFRDAEFKPTDSDGSPGRTTVAGGHVQNERNTELTRGGGRASKLSKFRGGE